MMHVNHKRCYMTVKHARRRINYCITVLGLSKLKYRGWQNPSYGNSSGMMSQQKIDSCQLPSCRYSKETVIQQTGLLITNARTSAFQQGSGSHFKVTRLHEDNSTRMSRFLKKHMYIITVLPSEYKNHMYRNIHQKKLLLIIQTITRQPNLLDSQHQTAESV